jgi:hypothetical protein
MHIPLPHSIAGDDDILISFVIALDLFDFGDGDEHLLVVGFELVDFVVEVSEGAGDVYVAVDAAFVDFASGFDDAVSFGGEVGFVVFGESDGDAVSAEDGAAVADVCQVDAVGGEEEDVGCASGAEADEFGFVGGDVQLLSDGF